MKIPQSSGSILIKITVFFLIFTVIVAILTAISTVVKLVIISALLAYILDPLANFLESRGTSRTSATAAVFLVLFTLAGILSMAFLPVLSEEIKALQSGHVMEKAESTISGVEELLVDKLAFLGFTDLHLLTKMQNAMTGVGNWLLAHFFDAASVITGIILIPFIVFFLMKDGREFKKGFVSIMPNRYFEFTLYLFHKLNMQIGNYIRGQVLDSIIVGILSMFALWLLDVKYFFLIGVFAGLANLIPYFGPVTGASIAIVISILQSGNFQTVLYIIIAFIIIRLIDDVLVQPLVVAKTVHMHPVMVLLAILIGGKLFGILGMLLSVPITGFIKVVVHESIMNYRRYGKRVA